MYHGRSGIHKSKAMWLVAWLSFASVSHRLVEGIQDPVASYKLPPNIYDDIAPGLDTPLKDLVKQGLPLSAGNPTMQHPQQDAVLGTLVNRVITPFRNAVFAPGDEVRVVWISKMQPAALPQEVPKALLDRIPLVDETTGVPLSEGARRERAQAIMAKQQETHALAAMHDNPIRLHSLRLISPSLTQSRHGRKGEAGTYRTSEQQQQQSSNTILTTNTNDTNGALESWNIVQAQLQSSEGYPISQGILGSMTSTSTGGQMSWRIAEDWPLEGEFEIWIHAQGSPTQAAKSPTFWILRDRSYREKHSALTDEPSLSEQDSCGGNQISGESFWRLAQERKKRMGVFLGLLAMIVVSAAVSLCCIVPYYRRQWKVEPLNIASLEQATSTTEGQCSLMVAQRGNEDRTLQRTNSETFRSPMCTLSREGSAEGLVVEK